MPTLKSLKQHILTECDEDYVGLWSVIRDVEESLSTTDETIIRKKALSLLHDMLVAGEIKAGFPTNDGSGFRSLCLTPEKIIEQIETDWPVGARRPTIGEGVWFTSAK
jgi:hypothetical protein